MNKVEGGSSEGARPTFRPRLEPVPAGGPPFAPTQPEAPAKERGIFNAVREHGGRGQGRGGRGAGTGVPGVPGGERHGPGMSRRRFLGLAAVATAAGVEVAVETAGVGPISLLRRFFGGRSPNPDGGSILPSATPEKTVGATATPEPTQKPEVKSSPYNFINQRVYLDGKLTLQAEEHLPTITEGPENIYSHSIDNGKTVPYTPSNGLEANPNRSESAEKIIQGIEVGLLIAWSSQKDISESQKDLITTFEEPRAEQLRKLNLLKERSAKGERFEVTMRAYKDDGFVDEDITINLGDDYRYKIDELSRPPVQIVWQTNFGSGIRISPENKEFRIEVMSQFRGAAGSTREKFYLANLVSTTIAYFPSLVIGGESVPPPGYKSPPIEYEISVVRPLNVLVGNKYFIYDVSETSDGKEWINKDSVMHPLP